MTKSSADQIGGADYTFDCTGNVTVMRKRWNHATAAGASRSSSGLAPAGAEISTAAVSAGDGPGVAKGTAFGGARGRTDVPKIVDWYMEARSRSIR